MLLRRTLKRHEELEKLHRYDWKRRLFAIIMLLLILASIVAGMFFV